MKQKTKNKNKSINLALYFGLLVAFIILVSISFKVFDIFRKSKFDGENKFTVAILNDKNAQLVSVSPKEGTISKLIIEEVKNPSDLNELSIPINSIINPNSDIDVDPKSIFFKLILKSGSVKKDLTVVDLFRLGFYSNGISSEKVRRESLTFSEAKEDKEIISVIFVDPVIIDEKVSIQITNSTQISGLGNKVAKYITNMGGSIVLVNTSQNTENESKIIYGEESYTVDKLSKELGIAKEKDENRISISEILVIIGKDKRDILKY